MKFQADPVVLLSYITNIEASIYDEDIVSKNEKASSASDLTPRKPFFRINKALVPLKLAQFFWFGGSIAVQIFLMVYLKEKGLSIAHLSIINIINPIFQFFGPSISGMIADKLGRSKPVMFGNFIVILIAANCLLLIPSHTTEQITSEETQMRCEPDVDISYSKLTYFDSHFVNCTIHCQDRNITFDSFNDFCLANGQLVCNLHGKSLNTSFDCDQAIYEENFHYVEMDYQSNLLNCSVKCSRGDSGNSDTISQLFIFALVLMTIFNTSLTNIYRCMDLTVMTMVRTHNSDFGRERFWSMVSLLIFPPLTAYLIDVTADEVGKRNFATVFYIFDIMTVLSMIAVWKLDVQASSPGKKMWKKAFTLVKNLDVVMFILAVVVLGTAWGFKKIFTSLYLEELHAPSILFSLVTTVGGFVGLPFLVTSNWWVQKLGSNNLVLCAFVAYTIDFYGYSFLVNPWWCLACEVMNIFHMHLLWVAVVRHTHEIAPSGLTSTVISTAGGIHFALGRSFGSSIGGLTMSQYGGRQAFRLIGNINIGAFVVYGTFLIARSIYKKWKNARDTERKNEEMNGSTDSQSCSTIELDLTNHKPEKANSWKS